MSGEYYKTSELDNNVSYKEEQLRQKWDFQRRDFLILYLMMMFQTIAKWRRWLLLHVPDNA